MADKLKDKDIEAEIDKKNNLILECDDLLAPCKSSQSEGLVKIGRFQVVVEMGPLSLQKNVGEELILRLAITEAKRSRTELGGELERLVKEVKDFQAQDAKGDKTACGKANRLVESYEKKLTKALHEYGYRFRKALKPKLSADVKTVARGSFKGLELVAKFKYEDDDEEFPDDLKKAVGHLVKECEECQRATKDESGLRSGYVKAMEAYFKATPSDNKKAQDDARKVHDWYEKWLENFRKRLGGIDAGLKKIKAHKDLKSDKDARKYLDALDAALKDINDPIAKQLDEIHHQEDLAATDKDDVARVNKRTEGLGKACDALAKAAKALEGFGQGK